VNESACYSFDGECNHALGRFTPFALPDTARVVGDREGWAPHGSASLGCGRAAADLRNAEADQRTDAGPAGDHGPLHESAGRRRKFEGAVAVAPDRTTTTVPSAAPRSAPPAT
jgi:hypothetical protein